MAHDFYPQDSDQVHLFCGSMCLGSGPLVAVCTTGKSENVERSPLCRKYMQTHLEASRLFLNVFYPEIVRNVEEPKYLSCILFCRQGFRGIESVIPPITWHISCP